LTVEVNGWKRDSGSDTVEAYTPSNKNGTSAFHLNNYSNLNNYSKISVMKFHNNESAVHPIPMYHTLFSKNTTQ
jgi:hypothetical protein